MLVSFDGCADIRFAVGCLFEVVKNTKKIMCYHYGLAKPAEVIKKRFKLRDIGAFEGPFFHANAFEKRLLPVIGSENPDKISHMRWGLIPHWSDTDTLKYATQNCMVETAAEKPAFRKAFQSGRCLIPADGFYEWQHRGKVKQPWFISHQDQSVFAFAGIYDTWQPAGGGPALHTFSILTMPASPLMAQIHNTKKRMPVILPADVEHLWLRADLSAQGLEALWQVAAAVPLTAFPISQAFLKIPDGPEKRMPLV
jgi:putative SOS response-associated peptidase YedK